ncbi:MAG: hypothetical protein AAB568_00165 [Patescibacteria group bacterium]
MRITTLVCFLFIFLFTGAAIADDLENEIIIAGGGAPLLPILTDWDKQHTAPISGFVAYRLRAPDYTPLGLEANVVAPYGLGLNALIDILRLKKTRTHISFGVFANLIDSVSVMQIDRRLDITTGVGTEIELAPKTRLTIDWRVFLPWPWEIIPAYGDFFRPFYEEAAKGGQIWIGIAQEW